VFICHVGALSFDTAPGFVVIPSSGFVASLQRCVAFFCSEISSQFCSRFVVKQSQRGCPFLAGSTI
jgi:hypothetical protein